MSIELKQTPQGYKINIAKTDPEIIRKIKARATVRAFTFNPVGPPAEPFPVYQIEKKKTLIVPRFFMKQHFSKYILKDPVSLQEQGEDINVRFKGTLRKEQKPIVDAMLTALYKEGGGIINAPCGTGKTAMADYLITMLKKKTLIIVHNRHLADQHVERLKQFTNASIGFIQGKTIDVEGKDVVIAMLQSLSMKKFPKDLFKQFGTIIVDECHHIAARVFSRALFKISTQFMIGLSATPQRDDGLSKVFYWFLGPIRYSKIIERDQIITVKMIRCEGAEPWYDPILNVRGKANVPSMLTRLSEYPDRNNFIVTQVTKLSDEGRNILVLSGRTAHVKELTALLIDRGIDAGFIMGCSQKKKSEKEEMKLSLNCQVIVGTYQSVSEGFDCDRLDTLVLATPVKKITQSIGRILRKKRYQLQPLIIDIEDKFSSFKSQGSTRRRIYKQQKKPDCLLEIYDKTIGLDPNSLGNRNDKILRNNKKKDDLYNQLGNTCLI